MEKKNNRLCLLSLAAGMAAVMFQLISCVVFGQDMAMAYHDQLDGEFIAYILQAKHLFQNTGLPEFMGGMAKEALFPPAPAYVLLFLTGNYILAYAVMLLAGSLTGFLGIWLLGRDLFHRPFSGAVVGVLFAYLPFLPVYGLSQYGVPLLIWCFLRLSSRSQDSYGWKDLFCTVYPIVYALCSSLVLVGFAALLLWMAGFFCIVFLDRKQKKIRPFRLLLPWILMLVTYIAENGSLLLRIFSGEKGGNELSHKAEYVLNVKPFGSTFWNAFAHGEQHSEALHEFILAASMLVAVIFCIFFAVRLCRGKKFAEFKGLLPKSLLCLLICLGINLSLSLIAAFWNCSAGVALRNGLQALRGFQLNRVLWLAPAFWYLALLALFDLALPGQRTSLREGASLRKDKRRALAGSLFLLLLTAVTGFRILRACDLKLNLQKMRNPSYAAITYSDYYALGVMDQVRDYLTKESGLDVSQYRVVSLGIDPAAAYYAGFYCLDGYSNNYPVSYKHYFRRILAPELAKSDYLKAYYDTWGNRCYLYTSEFPGYYNMKKGTCRLEDYEINLEPLAEKNCRYLLSAAYIANAEEQGLRLMREESFKTPDSYYEIFLYEIPARDSKTSASPEEAQ